MKERGRETDSTYKDEERRLAAGQGRCEYKRSIHGRLSAHTREATVQTKGLEGKKVGRSNVGSTDSTRIINGECISRRELGGGDSRMVRIPCTARSTVPALTQGGLLLQWPDSVLSRAAVRAAVLGLDAVVPFAVVWLGAAYACRPAPPAVVATVALSPDDAADFLLRYRMLFTALTAGAALELAWYIVARIGIALLDKSRSRNSSRPRQQSRISSEERWRLWRSMVESSNDPAQWLKTAFLPKPHRHAPRGADDPAFAKLKLESVGRTNIEEVKQHFRCGPWGTSLTGNC